MYGLGTKTTKPIHPHEYGWEDFQTDFKRFGIKENDHEAMGVNAVYLLMKGKYITQLTDLLREEEMPKSIKLMICNFLVRERFFETHEVVEKTLVDTFHTSLKEWKAHEEAKRDTV